MPAPFVPFVNPVAPLGPGIPILLNQIIADATSPASVTGSFLSGPMSQRCGIYAANGSTPLLQADSVGSIEFAQDYRISDYPQEKGAFESYNKVQVPFQAKVEFLLNVDREPFLQAIGAQLASLDLVQVVTPEISYPSANLTHYGYRRTARNGVTLIAVDVWVEEVRITATTTLSNTQSASGTDPQQDGPVQADQTTTTAPNLSTGLPSDVTKDIPPAFYDSSGLPTVPNAVSQLGTQQQMDFINYTQTLQVTSAQVYPPDENNNVTVLYPGPF